MSLPPAIEERISAEIGKVGLLKEPAMTTLPFESMIAPAICSSPVPPIDFASVILPSSEMRATKMSRPPALTKSLGTGVGMVRVPAKVPNAMMSVPVKRSTEERSSPAPPT